MRNLLVVASLAVLCGAAGARQALSDGDMERTTGGLCLPKPIEMLNNKQCVEVEVSCWDEGTIGDGDCDWAYIYRFMDGETPISGWLIPATGQNCFVTGPDCGLDPWLVKLSQTADMFYGTCEDAAMQFCFYSAIECARGKYYLTTACIDEGIDISVFTCGCDPGPGGMDALLALRPSN